jgi:hypothetical protein
MGSPATVQQLTERLKQVGREQLLRLPPEILADIDIVLSRAKHEELDAMLAREEASFEAGPLAWATKYTKTENPQYLAQGAPYLAPFPKKTYFVELFRAFLDCRAGKDGHNILFVPKSRTMMSSWSAAVFSAWAAQWKREETVIQTLNEDRALHLVDYVRQLLDYQEPWISELHPVAKRSVFAISWKGGGEVAAIPGGADAIRAFHPTMYIQDESAFMVEGYQALMAVMPSHAKAICISTANAGWFGDACSL